jgi:hypothetical protein
MTLEFFYIRVMNMVIADLIIGRCVILKSNYFIIGLFFAFGLSCKPNDKKLFELLKNTGIEFENTVVDGKLENGFTFRNFYNGGGVALGDINNDGFADVFLTANMSDNKLYLNKGDFKFDDISETAGLRQDSMWSTGVVMADINNDGWLDIYVCNSGHMENGNRRNKLYLNNRNLTFTESARNYGLDISAYTTQVSFFDYDLDGDLDCFMINNSPIPINTLGFSNRRDLPEAEWPVAEFLKGGGDHLYKNDNGRFTEVTKQAGIHGSLISFGLGVSVSDINNDGYPDIYVSNDSYERDYLYINQKNGTFLDQFEKHIEHTSFSSMGADIADINNDGYYDIFTTDMLPQFDYRLKTLGSFDNIDLYRSKEKAGFYRQFMKNCLQLNNKNGKFCEIANYSGVAATDWSWGALLFDADNDGLNDIYVCNGINRDVTDLDFMNFFANDIIQKMVLTGKKDNVYEVLKHIPVTPMENVVFRNNGDLIFSDEGKSWGITQPSFSNGAAYGDLDNDGDLDLIVNNENQPSFVYKNNARQISKNNYIAILLKGKPGNTFAIGSKIQVHVGNQILSREAIPSRGFQSSVDYKVIIGLGEATKIDSMTITWPDLTYSKYDGPLINKLHILSQTQANKPVPANLRSNTMFFLDSGNRFNKHEEDDHVDFYNERNIPIMLSKEGPGAASGDVNGDALDDVYIGGATNQAGQLYIQTMRGEFIRTEQKDFQQYADFEDVAVLLFDSDMDGDPDLFVGAGGNTIPPNSRQLQHRLYKNNGKGKFTIDTDAFPNNNMNISVAAAHDFDKDGDLDLFVGSKSVPFDYGADPASYIYVNDGKGHFKDIAGKSLSHIGMVSDAVWADITGNSDKELIIVGQWMAPRIFSYLGNHLTEIKTNLSDMSGWWQSVNATDLNGDGKTDIILGNIGENFFLHPDKENPVKLWRADVDGNGDVDKILTRTVDGKDKPVFLKNDLQEQIPSIKKENLKHSDYAKKSIQELFKPKALAKAVVKEFNYPSSCIAMNNGNGNFSVQKLPYQAQLSSLNVIHCTDLNKDSFMDILTGNNVSGFPPQLEKLDASFGDVFMNNGKGQFTWIGPEQSGLNIVGEVRDIAPLKGSNSGSILFLRNNDYPLMYRVKNSAR